MEPNTVRPCGSVAHPVPPTEHYSRRPHVPRRPRSPLSAFGSVASLAIAALLASCLAVGGASAASAEEAPPTAPTAEATAPPAEEAPPTAPVAEATAPPAATLEEPAETDVSVSASIQGTVTVPDGSGATDVSVSAYRHNGNYFEYAAGVVTGDGGGYVIHSLQPGTYTLQFSPPFDSALIAEWWNDRPNQWSADSFEVAEGSTVSGMEAQLAIGGAVEGVVSGPGGVSVPYANVTAYAYDNGLAVYRGNALSDSSGAFAITGLAEGTYTLQFSSPWGSEYSGEWWNDKPDQHSADTFSVVGGETVSGLLAELAVGGSISGVVTGADDLPLKGIMVSATGSRKWASAFTDAEGRYELTGLAADDYTISFQPDAFDPGAVSGYIREYWDDQRNQFEANSVTVGAGAAVAGIDAQLSRGGTISGIVAANGVPVEGVRVSVSGPGWGSAMTGADGRYEVTGLSPGTYSVYFSMPSGSPYFHGNAEAQVAGGETTTLDHTPESGAIVRGRVTVAESGAPVAGATVTKHAFNFSGTTTVTTDADGNFSIAPVEAGRYLLEVSGPGITTTWSGGSPSRTGATSFTVSAGGDTVVDLVAAASASGVVMGTVSATTAEGTASREGAFVELYTERGALRSTITGADGSYRFEGLDAGSYSVRFKQSRWSSSSWWWDGSTGERAPFFDLGGTDSVTHDFTIPGLGSLTGVITVDGEYSGEVRVEAFDAVTGEKVAQGSAFGGWNQYNIWDVPAGEVKLRFSGPVRDAWWGGAADFASAAALTVPAGGGARADATLSLDTVLSGVVLGPDGQPLAEASVLIRPDGSTSSYYARADAAGVYRLTGLEPGRYTMTAQPWGTVLSTHEPVIVDIGVDVAALTRDIQLAEDVLLAGTITFSGQPVEGCWGARIVDAPHGDGFCTDSTGAYEVRLAPGEYVVSFGTKADIGAAGVRHRVTILPGQTGTIELDSDLEAGGAIEGTVTADLGNGPEPIGGVWVSARGAAGYGGEAVTAADGTYRLWGLEKGVAYTVQFGYVWNDFGMEWWDGASSPDNATTVVLGEELITGVDALLTRGGAISGRVVDADGLGASAVLVEVYSMAGERVGEVTANPQGAYELIGLSTGDYKLRFVPSEWATPGLLPEWWQDAGSAASAASVAVTAGQETSRIDATLNEVGTVAVELADPQVVGAPRVGETLTATAVSTTDGASLTYEWLADDGVVAGATDAAFVLTPEQVGKRMSVRVTSSADGYLPTTLTSTPTDVVAAAEPDPTLPQISGAPVVGAKLEVDPGEKTRGTAFAYQWYADGVPIADATEETVRLTAELEGAQIDVQVSTLRRGVVIEKRTSEPTLRVLLAGSPTVSGAPTAGSTITANPGVWTAATKLAYQWYADGEAIDGATAARLDLTQELVGARIWVSVSGHLPGYPLVERSSSKVSLIVRA